MNCCSSVGSRFCCILDRISSASLSTMNEWTGVFDLWNISSSEEEQRRVTFSQGLFCWLWRGFSWTPQNVVNSHMVWTEMAGSRVLQLTGVTIEVTVYPTTFSWKCFTLRHTTNKACFNCVGRTFSGVFTYLLNLLKASMLNFMSSPSRSK